MNKGLSSSVMDKNLNLLCRSLATSLVLLTASTVDFASSREKYSFQGKTSFS